MRTDQTLAIVKPDAVGVGLDVVVLRRALGSGFRVAAMRRGRAAPETWEKFYAEHADKPFFRDLMAFMASGPVVVLALESAYTEVGGAPAWDAWRRLLGATDPRRAFPDTLRGMYGDKTGEALWRNVGHGSASAAEAEQELRFWFAERELDANAALEPAGSPSAPMAEEAVRWDALHCYKCGAPGIGVEEGSAGVPLVTVPRYLSRCQYAAGCDARALTRTACSACVEVLRTDPLRHFRECARRQPLPPGHPQADPDVTALRAKAKEALVAAGYHDRAVNLDHREATALAGALFSSIRWEPGDPRGVAVVEALCALMVAEQRGAA